MERSGTTKGIIKLDTCSRCWGKEIIFYSLCTNGFEVFRDLNTFSGDCIFVPFAKLNSFAVALRHHIIYMKVTFNLHIVQLPLISDVFVRCKNQIYLLRRNWSKVN